MYAYPSLFQALRGMERAELFRGFLASSLRDAPYAGLFVVFYESIKRDLPSDWNSAVVHSSAAACAGALATLATHPFDVIKVHPCSSSLIYPAHSHFVDEDTSSFGGKIPRVCKDCFDNLAGKPYDIAQFQPFEPLQQRGIRGYFAGTTLRLSRKVLSSAIAWAVYEGVLIFMRSA